MPRKYKNIYAPSSIEKSDGNARDQDELELRPCFVLATDRRSKRESEELIPLAADVFHIWR